MNINLKLLHTFLLVAEHNSFRRAAEESNRSQSAISMQIRQLEQQLGISLFHRTTRRVQLTREGELLLDYAHRALHEMQVGLRQIKEAGDLQRGRLSFACAPSIAATRLPQVLAAFQKEYPAVTADVRELGTSEMLESVRRQEVDFGIGAKIPNSTEFHFRPIAVDELYALIPTSFKLGRSGEVTLTDLCRVPTLLVTGSSALQNMLEGAQRASGVTLDVRYDVRQVQTQIGMAIAGLGAAILPHIAVPATLDPHLVAARIVGPPLALEVSVVTLPGQSLQPIASRFIDLLQRILNENEASTGTARSETRNPRTSRRRHLALASSQRD